MIKFYSKTKKYNALKIACVVLISIQAFGALFLFTIKLCNNNDLAVIKKDINSENGVVSSYSKDGKSLKILSLSDLHNHSFDYANTNLIKELETIKNNESIDIISINGDMIDSFTTDAHLKNLDLLYSKLSEFNVPTFFTSGNHEWYASKGSLEKELALINKYNFTYLDYLGGSVPKNNFGEPDYFIGTDDKSFYSGNYVIYGNTLILGMKDLYNPKFKENYLFNIDNSEVSTRLEKAYQNAKLDKNFSNVKFKMLLTHRPDFYVDTYSKYGFDLVLAGHTHGGQIKIGDFGIAKNYLNGYYVDKKMYITQGLGTSNKLKIRINTTAEVSLLTIK